MPIHHSLVVFAIYEPLALILGLFGLVRGLRERSPLDASFGIWLILALLFTTALGHRDARWILSVSLPLALLAGRAVQYLVERSALQMTRREGLAFAAGLCLVAFSYVELGGYLQLGQGPYLGLAGLGAGLLIAALIGYAVWVGRAGALRVGVCLILALALVLTIRGSVALAYDRARDPWEPMLNGPTSGTLDTFGPFLEHLSLLRAGDPRAVDILYEQRLGAGIPWLLREYPNARETVRVGAQSGATILISAMREADAEPPGYVGQSFSLREWRPEDARSVTQLLEWVLFRQPGPEAVREAFWVWVRVEPGGGDGE